MTQPTKKILDRAELVETVERLRSSGNKIILANGCFDLLNVGHVRYLQGAKDLGGILIVGINSDKQVAALKGAGRPVITESERAEVTSALSCVDFVTIFEEPTVTELIYAIQPDVHTKGTDYTVDTVPEREIVREIGGIVAIVGDPKDHSSTELIGRTRN